MQEDVREGLFTALHHGYTPKSMWTVFSEILEAAEASGEDVSRAEVVKALCEQPRGGARDSCAKLGPVRDIFNKDQKFTKK